MVEDARRSQIGVDPEFLRIHGCMIAYWSTMGAWLIHYVLSAASAVLLWDSGFRNKWSYIIALWLAIHPILRSATTT